MLLLVHNELVLLEHQVLIEHVVVQVVDYPKLALRKVVVGKVRVYQISVIRYFGWQPVIHFRLLDGVPNLPLLVLGRASLHLGEVAVETVVDSQVVVGP